MDFDEPNSIEKPSGTKRKMIKEIPVAPLLAMPKLGKPKSTTTNRFGFDASILKIAEEESELLDSL